MRGNVCRLFFEAAAAHPKRTALAFAATGESLVFDALRERVERFAGGLAAEGFGLGKRAIVMVPMSIDLYVAVLGVLAAGGAALFIDPWIGIRRIAAAAAAASPDAFIGVPRAHLLRMFHRELREIPLTIATGSFASRLMARHRFADLRGSAPLADAGTDEVALITYTTGSSGEPKGVVRTHQTLAAQHEAIREEFPAAPDDVDMTTFPVFALSNLAAGLATVIPPVRLDRVAEADAQAVLAAIEDFGVRTLTASPPLFDRLAVAVRSRGAAPPLRRIVTGGAVVTDAQLRTWSEAFGDTAIEIAYGSSEAEPVARISAAERLAEDASSGAFLCGRPVPQIETAVIPIERGPVERVEALGAGTIGELVVTGPHVCRTYDGNEAAFRENKIVTGGRIWHRMGDTGWFDERGRFWLAGRVHTTIHRGGEELPAQMVEERARRALPEARRVAAVGMPGAAGGDRLVLVVEGEADRAADRLHDAGLAPDEVIVTRRALPLDPRHNSKIDYGKLREMLERGWIR